jgi:uncharacterized cupredoxin-like copper-binding protein
MFEVRKKHGMRRQWAGRILLLLALAAIVAACGQSAATNPSGTPTATQSIPKMTITTKDFAFDMPESISTGYVDVMVVNNGAEVHQAQLVRLNNGVTLDQFKEALKKGPQAALPLVTAAGGISAVKPSQSQEITLNLAQGQYVALCFIAGKDNVPHTEKGMIKPFTVTGPSNVGQVSAPKADVDVVMKDFTFGLPSTLKSGPLTYKVTNEGLQPHEMAMMKLAPGQTIDDVKAALQSPSGGPPPGDFVGGAGALAPGSSAWLRMSLEPGNYVVVCFVPDPASGKAHAELGMITPFTVQE